MNCGKDYLSLLLYVYFPCDNHINNGSEYIEFIDYIEQLHVLKAVSPASGPNYF